MAVPVRHVQAREWLLNWSRDALLRDSEIGCLEFRIFEKEIEMRLDIILVFLVSLVMIPGVVPGVIALARKFLCPEGGFHRHVPFTRNIAGGRIYECHKCSNVKADRGR